MWLADLQDARKRLRSTDTVVTHRDGHRTVERDGATIDQLPPPDVLPPALQPEPRRICICPPAEPTWVLPTFEGFRLPPLCPGTVRAVTWNVWFAPSDFDARMAALFTEALSTAPDVICLQEVLPGLAAAVRASAVLSRAYAVSPNWIDAYGCLLLVRHELRPTFHEHVLPTSMGRTLLVAECRAAEGDAVLAVATVHLESLNNALKRARQLALAHDALAAYAHVLLCGDFNFDATRNFGDWRAVPPRPLRPKGDNDSDEEEAYAGPLRREVELENSVLGRTLPGYLDVWHALNPAMPGHTFDGGRNPYVADPDEQMRYDRVMARGMVPQQIEMLGMGGGAHGEGVDVLVPSDHYGLFAIAVVSRQ